MTSTSFSIKAIAPFLLCCCISLLSGCTSLPAPSDRTESPPVSKDLFPSLRLSSLPAAPPAQAEVTTLQKFEIAGQVVALPTIDLTREAEDIFQRIRNGFAMSDINNDLVLYQQQWYLNRPDYLRRMVERSSPFLHHIVEEIEKRGMPMELALLPMVESAYNPAAYSRAKAAGLWQFIPATGKRYKLEQNWWKDERRDIVASTAAALEYLQEIYDLHGDWHLALASYNWGEGAVARAVNKNKALDRPTDYLSLTMPRETQNYVPKLQALKNIFSKPNILKELGVPKIPNRPYFATVSKPTNIDVKLAAQLAGMPVQEFVALNPAHNRPVIVSDTPMVIPAEKIDTFVNNLEAHKENNKPLSSWQSYTLRPGEKLESVAPRFGMTVANLKAVNGIRGSIRTAPGLTLLVPNGSAEITPLPGQLRLPEANPAPASGTKTYTVRKGDNLPGIAKRHGTSIAELRRLNQLQGDKVTVGTRITLPAPQKSNIKPTPRQNKLTGKSPAPTVKKTAKRR